VLRLRLPEGVLLGLLDGLVVLEGPRDPLLGPLPSFPDLDLLEALLLVLDGLDPLFLLDGLEAVLLGLFLDHLQGRGGLDGLLGDLLGPLQIPRARLLGDPLVGLGQLDHALGLELPFFRGHLPALPLLVVDLLRVALLDLLLLLLQFRLGLLLALGVLGGALLLDLRSVLPATPRHAGPGARRGGAPEGGGARRGSPLGPGP